MACPMESRNPRRLLRILSDATSARKVQMAAQHGGGEHADDRHDLPRREEMGQVDRSAVTELTQVLIAKASEPSEKLAWANRLGTRRLAQGILPKLDACFAALQLT